MRLKAFDNRGFENVAKLHMPSFNDQEKEKIIEQYYAAKRQLRGMPLRSSEEDSIQAPQ